MSEAGEAGVARHDGGGLPHHHRVASIFFVLALAGPVLGVIFGKSPDFYPRLASGAYSMPLAAFGIAALILPLRSPKDFFGGALLVGLGLFALWASSDLQGMRGFSFGAGTAPRMFGGLLVALSAGIALTGLLTDGPAMAHYSWRGPLFVMASIVFFALAIRPLGLVVSAFVSFMIAAMGSNETRWLEAAIVGACLTLGCALLFPYVLGLPMPMFPRFLIQ